MNNTMIDSLNISNTVGEVVAQDYRAALLFEKLGIDFCCKGHRTLGEVCDLKQIDKNTLLQNLKALASEATYSAINYQSWPIDLLVDYIEKKHHRYVIETSHLLIQYLDKLCSVHGVEHPELFKVFVFFNRERKTLKIT